MTSPPRRKKSDALDLCTLGMQVCRWDKPAGAYFLFWPTLWGLLLGAPHHPSWKYVALCALGTWVMRSAGCIYNDWVDRDVDRQVRRTASRPLASGALSSFKAGILLCVLLGVGALILFALPNHAIFWGLAALPLIALYPWMKRWTYWPQMFLGITFNWGLLVGYAIERERMSWRVLPWFIFGMLWTVLYDTIYAHQDLEDDRRIGVKSSALALGPNTKRASYLMLMGMAGCVVCISDGFPVVHGAAVVMIASVAYSVYHLPLKDPQRCGQWFKRHAWWGAWMAFALWVASTL